MKCYDSWLFTVVNKNSIFLSAITQQQVVLYRPRAAHRRTVVVILMEFEWRLLKLGTKQK